MRTTTLLGLALLVGCAGVGRRDDLLRRVVMPSLETRGLKRLELQVREHAYPGDPLRVRVLHDGKPVAGAKVEFDKDARESDAEGVAVFTAPEVRFPTTFQVTAAKPGYAMFREGTLDGRPYAALDAAHVAVHMPPGVKWGLPPAVLGCVRGLTINGAEGWGKDIPTGAISDKLEKAGLPFDMNDDYATKEEILDSLERAGRGDIWVFHGHGNDRDGDGVTDSLASGDNKLITVEELCERIRKDPPDVIIISGCGTANLLDALCRCGARLIIGYDANVWDTNAASAAEALIEGLLDGTSTIQQLLDATSAILRTASARACVREDLGISLASGAKLSDVTRRKTTTQILDFNLFFREPNGTEYTPTTVATLMDEDGLPVAGRLVTFRITWSQGMGIDHTKFDTGRTDAGGTTVGNRERLPRTAGTTTYARVVAVFDGDENYGPSRDDSFPQVAGR